VDRYASARTPRPRTRSGGRWRPRTRWWSTTAEVAGPHLAVRQHSRHRPITADARSPSLIWRSIMIADMRSAIGFARFLPAMSARCRGRPRTPRPHRHVAAADHAKAADQAGAQVRQDVAVQVRHEQDVELLRRHHQVHARRVHDPLVVLDVEEVARDVRAQSRNRPSLSFMMLALCTDVTFLRPWVRRTRRQSGRPWSTRPR